MSRDVPPPAHEASALHDSRDVVERPHGPSFPVLRRDLDVREPVSRADGFRHEADLLLVRPRKEPCEGDPDQFVGALESVQPCKRTVAEPQVVRARMASACSRSGSFVDTDGMTS